MPAPPPARRIAILAPMPSELGPVVRALSMRRTEADAVATHTARLGDVEVLAAPTGIGTKRAARAAERLLDEHPVDHMMVVGIAGGVGATRVGDVIVPTSVVDRGTARTYRPAPLPDAGAARVGGTLVTTDELITDPAVLERLAAERVVGLDMETAAVAAVCEARGCPWSVIRAVSDRADDHVDDTVMGLVHPDGSPNLPAVARLVLRQPGRVSQLARLARGSRSAADAAARVAAHALGTRPSVASRRTVRSVRQVIDIADARRRAARVLPGVLFDYVDGAAEDEVTARSNELAFRELAFRPRMAVGRVEPDLGVTLFGARLSLPVLLAPCGLVSVVHPDGAIGAARAAADRGTLSVLSTVAGTPLEEMPRALAARSWFQVYRFGGVDELDALVERAQRAGYAGLVITIDTPELGLRERDVRHGVTLPFRLTPRVAAHLATQLLARPGWVAGFAREAARRSRATGRGPDAGGTRGFLPEMARSPFTWHDIEHARAIWSGPLIVKGVLTADDARRAVGAGADGIVVSNHGGRQLEGSPATIRVLPEVVAAVGSQTTVMVDGGVRRGGDVVKALALGAGAVLIGRPYLYGLAIAGTAGVARVLRILETEMRRTMALLGCESVAELDPGWLRADPPFAARPEIAR